MPSWLVTLLTILGSVLSAYFGASGSIKAAIAKLEARLDAIEGNINRLETKQDKHNHVIERMYKLEQRVDDFMIAK